MAGMERTYFAHLVLAATTVATFAATEVLSATFTLPAVQAAYVVSREGDTVLDESHFVQRRTTDTYADGSCKSCPSDQQAHLLHLSSLVKCGRNLGKPHMVVDSHAFCGHFRSQRILAPFNLVEVDVVLN
jgi:hypothetical protein